MFDDPCSISDRKEAKNKKRATMFTVFCVSTSALMIQMKFSAMAVSPLSLSLSLARSLISDVINLLFDLTCPFWPLKRCYYIHICISLFLSFSFSLRRRLC